MPATMEKSGLTALMHPVSVAIISNHFTRTILHEMDTLDSKEPQYTQVVGALLGKQDSKWIEVQNCFELESKVVDGKIVINQEYYKSREELFAETFPNQAFLGFYVTGDHLHADDVDHHLYEQALRISEFAFIAKFNPITSIVKDQVPLTVFDPQRDPQNPGRFVFSPVPVKLISDVAERIGTDHATRFTVAGDKNETTASKKLSEQASALKMLYKGLALTIDYIKAVEANELPGDAEVLRELFKLAVKINFLRTGQIQPDGNNDAINDKLIVFLTIQNKISSSMFSLIGKLNMIATEIGGPHVQHVPAQVLAPMKRKENF